MELVKYDKDSEMAIPSGMDTYEDYLKLENLPEWPERLTSENKLDLVDEKIRLGDPDNLRSLLKEATPVDMERFQRLDARLKRFDNDLYEISSKMLKHSQQLSPTTSPKARSRNYDREFPDLTAPPEVVPAQVSQKMIAIEYRDKMLESQKRSLDQCEFPGFRIGELTELPGSLEAPQILHRVTKAQDFNAGFRKFWKKIFQSEASIAMMQDSFWWIYIELFQKNKKKFVADQSYLFDRLADSFVALFSSIDMDLKDKVLAEYPKCLAQALFAAFWEAFPESIRKFDGKFKQTLCNICYEWVSGTKATPGVYEKWNVKALESKAARPAAADDSSDVHHGTSDHSVHADGSTDAVMSSYDKTINEFLQVLNTLGVDTPELPTRQTTKMTANQHQGAILKQEAVKIADNSPLVSASVRESCHMGAGPVMERCLYDLDGKSPLIKHFMRMRRLAAVDDTPKIKVFRTEVVKQPEQDQQTYRELIKETKANSKKLSKEYQRVCEMTNNEILRIEKNTRLQNRKIEKLQKELMFCKNSLEIKAMGEKVLGKPETDTARLAIEDDSDADSDETE